jgi:hypothetical protein
MPLIELPILKPYRERLESKARDQFPLLLSRMVPPILNLAGKNNGYHLFGDRVTAETTRRFARDLAHEHAKPLFISTNIFADRLLWALEHRIGIDDRLTVDALQAVLAEPSLGRNVIYHATLEDVLYH